MHRRTVMRLWRFSSLGALIGCASVALASPPPTKPPLFTSAYTNLETDCRPAVAQSEAGEGQDVPLQCKRIGGYSVKISFTAEAAYIAVEEGAFYLDLGEDRFGLVSPKSGRKIEWRLANRRPFAVIFRTYDYSGGAPVEILVVKGLKGFSHINTVVNPRKAPDANAAAHQRADEGYLNQKK